MRKRLLLGCAALALLASPAAAVTLTHVGSGSANPAATAVATTSANVPTGALIIVVVDVPANSGAHTVTDQVGNTYTKAVECFQAGVVADYGSAIYYAFNAIALPSGDTVTYTLTASDFAAIDVSYATGMLTTSGVIDGAAICGTGSSAAPTSGTLTPASSGDLFVATANQGGASITQASGWATPPNVMFSGSDVSGSLTGAGVTGHAYTPSMASNTWSDAIAAFVVAAAPACRKTGRLIGVGC